MRIADIAVGKCYSMMGGRIVKVALIAPDLYGLQTIYFEQPELHRTMSLRGFAVIALREVGCENSTGSRGTAAAYRAT